MDTNPKNDELMFGITDPPIQKMPMRISMIRDGKFYCDLCETYIESVREHDCPKMKHWYMDSQSI